MATNAQRTLRKEFKKPSRASLTKEVDAALVANLDGQLTSREIATLIRELEPKVANWRATSRKSRKIFITKR